MENVKNLESRKNWKNWKESKSIAIVKSGAKDWGLSLVVYYSVIILVMLIIEVIFVQVMGDTKDHAGMSMNLQTFLFVLGVVMIRNSLSTSQDFCVSRKSCFIGFTIAVVAVCIICIIMEILIHSIAGSLLMFLPELIFPQSNVAEQIFMQFSMNLLLIFLGSLISMIYYKLSYMGKWIFSCGVVALIIIIVTFIGNIRSMDIFIIEIMTFLYKSINISSAALLIGSVILATGTNLLLRKATIKE